MVRQVQPFLMWFHLQPILLSILFLILLPWRGIQDCIVETSAFLQDNFACSSSMFSWLAHSFFCWAFQAGQVWLLCAIVLVALCASSFPPDGMSCFTRKWTLQALFFLPSNFSPAFNGISEPSTGSLVLCTQPVQVRLMKQQWPTQAACPTITHEQAFALSMDPNCPQKSFFCEEIFEFPPFKDCSDIDKPLPPSLLHLTGFAKESMANFAVMDPLFSDVDKDDSRCRPSSLITWDPLWFVVPLFGWQSHLRFWLRKHCGLLKPLVPHART